MKQIILVFVLVMLLVPSQQIDPPEEDPCPNGTKCTTAGGIACCTRECCRDIGLG